MLIEQDRHPLRSVDYGFFGPDSPTWKVWAAPTALIGFQRSVVLEHFDPFLTAAVSDTGKIYSQPQQRLDNTLAYFLTVALADSRRALQESQRLMNVHAHATGVEPVSGKRYSANNPTSQLWIHLTGWHSVLKCYEMFGPGPLTAAEEHRYWRECATAAELQTCKPSDVPSSREGVRDYFMEVRPRLCTSEAANAAMHYLLRTGREAGLGFWLGSNMIAPATIATLPSWMRELGGIDQPSSLDAAATLATRAAVRAVSQPRVAVQVIGQIAPKTARVLASHYRAGPPADPAVVTPQDARARANTADVVAAPNG